MLWENTGGPGDVVNAYTEIFGDGKVMDSMRLMLTQEEKDREQRERAEIERLCRKVKAERERHRFLGDLGIVKEAEIPDFHYHRYAAAFAMKAKEEGIILPENGYECWQCDDFLGHYQSKYPGLFYSEAPRNARITVNEAGKLPTGAPILAAA